MRTRRGGMSTVRRRPDRARRRSLIGVYLGFTKSIPFRHHYTITAAFASANNLRKASPVRIAGVEVGKVTERQARAARATTARCVTMRDRRQRAGRSTPTRSSRSARASSSRATSSSTSRRARRGAGGRPTATTFPVNADRDAGPVRPGADRAADRHARRPPDAAARVRAPALKGRAPRRFNDSIKYWKPAYRDSAIVSEALLGERPHDLSGYIRDAAAPSPARSTATASRCKDLITTSTRPPARSPARTRTSSAAVAELPRTLRAARPRSTRSTPLPRPCARFARDCARASRLAGPTIDATLPLVKQLRGLVSEPELRGLAADLRADRPGARPARPSASVPLSQQVRALGELPERASSCRGRNDTVDDPNVPADRPGLPGAAEAVPGPRRREPLGSTPTASGSACSPRAARTSSTSATASFGTTALPILGVNPPQPAQAPAAAAERAVRDAGDARPALDTPGAPPQQTQGRHLEPAVQGPLGEGAPATRSRSRRSCQLEREGLADKLKVADQGPDARRSSRSSGRPASDRDQQEPRRLRGDHRAGR